MSTGVIIARFQTPYLHEGHVELITEVKAKHDKLIVVLGVAPIKGSRKNPYDYYARERMLKRSFGDLIVLPLCDHPSDLVWSRNLDELLSQTFPAEKFELYGSRDSFIPHYLGKNMTVELEEHGDHNATELRKKYADKVLDSVDFRAGILYAYHNQYPKVYPTVDVAVFNKNKSEILLGRKANSKKWRLIGGFTDPEDENFATAARRELLEECGSMEISDMSYETSMKVEDWRYRSEVDKVITTLFSCEFLFGKPQAKDDIEALDWFDFRNLNEEIITEEHLDLIRFLKTKYN